MTSEISTVKGIVQPKPFGFEWMIDRFFADCEKVGDKYTSPIFPIHHSDKVTNWKLTVYPRGETNESQDYVSIFLRFESNNDSEVIVDYQLSIVGKQPYLPKSVANRTYNCSNESWSWGWPKFEKQDVIKDTKKGLLNDDKLTILFEIKFHDQDIPKELKDYDDLLNKTGKELTDYETLLENYCFSDVTFNIQDNKMHLHKAILSCRNSVFKAMFEQEQGPRKRQKLMEVVKITDIAYEVMKEVFRFIYSGKVEEIEEIAKDLLIAADRYKIVELKALCEKTLYTNLTVDNAIECLKVTELCDTIHLKTLVIKYIGAHYKDIVEKPEFGDLNSDIMHKIIKAIAKKN